MAQSTDYRQIKAWSVTAWSMTASYGMGIFYAPTKSEAEKQAKRKAELNGILPGEFNYSATRHKELTDESR